MNSFKSVSTKTTVHYHCEKIYKLLTVAALGNVIIGYFTFDLNVYHEKNRNQNLNGLKIKKITQLQRILEMPATSWNKCLVSMRTW